MPAPNAAYVNGPYHYVRTALFLDFDNVYSDLEHQDSRTADQFVSDPAKWLDWLSLQAPEDPEYASFHRRFVVKRCYLNPDCYWRARPFFVRSGFQTIDCPPLTKEGKTSADIHIVIDVLELLASATRIDEFVIMSTDADYTPLLRKISSHDRRSIVLAMGRAAAAYKASCDLLLDQKEFMDAVMGAEDSEQIIRARAAPAVPDSRRQMHTQEEPLPRIDDVIDTLALAGHDSDAAVTMASAVHRLRGRFGSRVDRLWLPDKKFKEFLLSLHTDRFKVSEKTPGYLFDPERHDLREDSQAAFTVGEVVSAKQFGFDHTEFSPRHAHGDAIASRQWYSTACTFIQDRSVDDPLVPAPMPGCYTTRGDWYLAIARGSRSMQVGYRALDLLCSRRANVARMQHGTGLPVRDFKSSPEKTWTRLFTVTSLGEKQYLNYGDVQELGVRSGTDPRAWLWRSGIQHYHRHERYFQKIIGRGWSSWPKIWDAGFESEQPEIQLPTSLSNPRNGFEVYDRLIDVGREGMRACKAFGYFKRAFVEEWKHGIRDSVKRDI